MQTIALILAILILVFVISKTDLNALVSSKRLQHRVFGTSTALFVLWLFKVSIHEGLVMHFLGITAFTLILGFRWAIISGIAVLLLSTVFGYDSFAKFGVNALLGVVVPVALSYVFYMFSFHKLPKHIFIYLFICAFFPGALSIGLKMALMSGYYLAEGSYTWNTIMYNYAQMTILLMFQEAFFNGMMMTCLIVYKPDWVYTYSDKFYLDGK